MTIAQSIQNTHQSEDVISKSVTQVTYNEHALLVINHSTCQAAVSLQGAHLLYWQPTTEKTPVIWLSEEALFKKGTAIRGGIPICWPWFGKAGNPIHGFARIVDWQLIHHTENENGVVLVFVLKNNEQTQKYWSHTFSLELTLHLGKSCNVELSCQGDFDATTALHTYFGIDDISKVTVKGLGSTYDERLTTQNSPIKKGEITFNQEVDRLYTQPESIITIEDSQRKIKLTNLNSSDCVVWNPWINKSKVTPDLEDESYKSFVCVETCRVSKPIKSTTKEKTIYGVKIELIKP